MADEKETPQQVCPEHTSNCFSRLTFSWLRPLLRLGYQRQLNPDDVWPLAPEEKANYLFTAYHDAKGQTILSRMFSVSFRLLIKDAFMTLIFVAGRIADPILLRLLVASLEQQSFIGLYYGIGLYVVGVLTAFGNHHHLHSSVPVR
jgi:ATP-binding cassette subfamily C (CFTR/MRP) protein 1